MDTVSQIKQKLDIVDVVGSYISLKKAGRNYKAPCPFHQEDTPSFMISPEIQIFKCFGCGEGGDMFSFIEKIEGVDFGRALEILADKAGIEVEQQEFDPNSKKKSKIYEINDLTAHFYHHLLTKHPAGKNGLSYLKDKRGLKPATISDFRLGYAPDSWDMLYQFLQKKGYKNEDLLLSGSVLQKRDGNGFIDKFRGRIVFPLTDVNGKIAGFTGRDLVGRDPKYLNSPETPVYNKSSYLYGLDKAKIEIKQKGAVFVEGQVDVLTAYQNGIKNVIASSGTALTGQQLRTISRFTKEIIFCFDPDTAGMSATARALELTNQLDLEVKICVIPKNYADLDEFLTNAPSDAKSALKNPVPIYDFYLVHALGQFSPETAYGKKKVVEYLAPIYSRIPNKVVQDHYVKAVAEKLNVAEDVFRTSLTSGKTVKEQPATGREGTNIKEKQSTEDYLLSLLLKSDIDTMGSIVYNLKSQSFISERCRIVFSELTRYIDSKPDKFDIKYLTGTLDDETKKFVEDIYLWDFGEVTSEPALLVKEINATVSRLEKDAVKRKLKELTEQIKLAEMEKNAKKIKDLSEEFKKLSEKLV